MTRTSNTACPPRSSSRTTGDQNEAVTPGCARFTGLVIFESLFRAQPALPGQPIAHGDDTALGASLSLPDLHRQPICNPQRRPEAVRYHAHAPIRDSPNSVDVDTDHQPRISDRQNDGFKDVTPRGLSVIVIALDHRERLLPHLRLRVRGLRLSVFLFFFLTALALSTNRFASSDSPLLTVRDIVSFLLDRAQDPRSSDFLAESPEQALLRLSRPKLNLRQSQLTPFLPTLAR